MINVVDFTRELTNNDLGPIIEVPCSYLSHFLNYLWDSQVIPVINPANEAVAMGIAAGKYLATNKIPVVAIQNSGFMNTLNALISLHQIYDLPVFMMVTWRGEGGKGQDAPEHDITGKNLEKIIKFLKLPYEIVDSRKYKKQIKSLVAKAHKTKKPVVLVIRKDTFQSYVLNKKSNDGHLAMTRFDAISLIKRHSKNKALFISSTGYPTRDSFTAVDTPDFYVVGSMGHSFSIALVHHQTQIER